jgi:hypothetical protein
LHRGAAKYYEQFDQWRANDSQNASLLQLRAVVSKADAKCKARDPGAHVSQDQPNPWRNKGIQVSSKRYLTRMLTVYNGTGAKYDVVVNPLREMVAVCERIVARFGAGVKLVPGPPKTEERIMEKARDGEGNYAAIRDVGRLSLIIEDFLLMPDVVEALFDCQDFEVSRIKNRLDPDHTAGYRDVQLLVREPKGKWIVEVQVIPQEMYELKNKDGYTKYRFIFEACKRAKKQQTSRDTFSNGTSQRGVASDKVGHATILNPAYEHHPAAAEGNVGVGQHHSLGQQDAAPLLSGYLSVSNL